MKHVNAPIPKLPKQYAHLQPVLNKLLAKKSTDRYRNAREFLEALDATVPSDTGTQPKVSRGPTDLGLLEFTTGKFRSLLGSQKSSLPIVLAIIGIIILLLAVVYGLSRRFVDQSEMTESAMPIDPSERARRDQQIATLLKLADAQRKIGLLAGDSKEDNAEATYRQVLTLEPENARALAGLEAIASEYARRAQQQLGANALPESLQQIELGLAASPQHRELMRLRQDVEGRMTAIRLQKAREEERRRSQLQAEQFLEQARSTFQEGLLEVSLAHIEQGLLAAPDQPDLLALRGQVKAKMAEQARQAAEAIKRQQEEEARRQAAAEQRRQEAGRYLTQAVEAQRKGEYAASGRLIEKGLEVVPDHAELLRLQEAVRAQLAAEQQRQAEQAKREQDIKTLLQQAEAHRQAKRLTAPAGNNAEAAYRQVLKLDEGNAEARAGLERIAGDYLQQARQQQSAGALQDSLGLIDQGLAVAPNQKELLQLRQEVERAIAEAKVRQEREAARRLQAEQFLAQARSRFKEGSLEISLAYIEQGLLAIPDHPDLLALREQVKAQLAERARQQAEAVKRQQEEAARQQAAEAERQKAEQARQQAEAVKRQQEEAARQQAAEAERQKAEQARQQAEAVKRQQEADQYLARAVESRRKGDQAASVQQIEKGLALVPDHEGLTRLRQEMSAEIAAQQRWQAEQAQREREIASLLEQADAHIQAWRLTTPAGNNAHETYRQVLKLDAGNAQAQAGLQRIAESYLQLARQRRATGALQDSLTFIEKGLDVVPDHAELLRLREEVRAEESAAQRQQEQQRQEQQKQDQQRRLEQQRQEEAQRLEQQRKLEQQQREQRGLEQQQRQERQRQLEQQRQEQQRLDRQRRLEQQQERQRLLEQRRQEQQKQEQQRKLEQQRKEPPRQESPPEPKPQPQSEPVKPRIFGTF